MSYLFDSNVFIFQLNRSLGAKGQSLLRTSLLQGGASTVMSRIKVLGYPQSVSDKGLRLIDPLAETSP